MKSILLTPARIGGVAIKNRIVMPPMTTRTADDEGCVTADTIAYDVARAEGGVGLIPTTPDNDHHPEAPWMLAVPDRAGFVERVLGNIGRITPP